MEKPQRSQYFIKLFGHFRIMSRAGVAIDIKNRRSRAILAILLANRDFRESRSKIWSLLWSHSPQEQASTSLRSALSSLRKSVNVDDCDVVSTQESDIFLDKDCFYTDFDQVYNATAYNAEVHCSINFSDELYSGLDGLDPMFDEWLYYNRIEKKNTLSERITKVVSSMPVEDHDAVEKISNDLLCLDPYNETAIKALISSRIQQQKIASATEMLKRYERRLTQDLGIECPTNIKELFDQIRTANPEKNTLAATYGTRSALRILEMKRLIGLAEKASLLNGMAVLITGPAGIGKTHLIDSFAAHLVNQNCITVKYDKTVLGTLGPEEFVRRLCRDLIDQNDKRKTIYSAESFSPKVTANNPPPLSNIQHYISSELPEFRDFWGDQDDILLDDSDFPTDILVFQLSEFGKIVIILDDFDSFSQFHSPVIFNWFSKVKDAAVLFVISSRTELPEGGTEFFDQYISLEPLEIVDMRALVEQRYPGEFVSDAYLQALSDITRGIPLLINQLLDTDVRPGGSHSLDRPDASENLIRAGRYPSYEATLFRLFFQGSKASRQVAARVALLGGRIARKRYEEIFEPLDERILDELAAVNLIRKDRLRHAEIEMLHATVSDVVIATIDFEEVQGFILPVESEIFSQSERINIGTYVVLNCGSKKYSVWVYRFIEALGTSEMFEHLNDFFDTRMGKEALITDSKMKTILVNSLVGQARFRSITRLNAVYNLNSDPNVNLICEFASSVTGKLSQSPMLQEGSYDFMGHFFSGNFPALFASVKEEVETATVTLARDQIPHNVERVVHLLGYFAMGNAQLGNFQQARSLANTAAGIAKQSSIASIGMFSEFYRQYVLTYQGELNNAMLNLRRVLRQGKHHSRSLETGLLVCHLGFVYQIVGKIDLAIEVSERLYNELPADETGILQAYLETSLTSAYTVAGDFDRAKTFARKSLVTAENGHFQSVIVWSLRNQGILAQFHKVTGLSGTLEDAYVLASELKMQPDLAHLLRMRSGLERRNGNTLVADELLDQAHSLYRSMGMDRWLNYQPDSQFGP